MRPLPGAEQPQLIKLGLGHPHMFDGKLFLSLHEPNFGSIQPGGQLHGDVGRDRNSM